MKQFRFSGVLFSTAVVLLFTSCGGNGNGNTTTTDSTAADTSAMQPAAPMATSTIVTTTENMVIITQKVANYAKWKVVYEGHDSVRLSHGVHNYVIGRGVKDSNMVLVALKVDDTAQAKAFIKDPGLKKAMQRGGVIGLPTIELITTNWQDTATIDSKIRSKTMFTVKDWDAWKKAFEDDKQTRTDNGIAARVIAHDLNNDKKVSLVTAITDSAKAYAFMQSDQIKKIRKASGVIGEPVRFIFKIVQRYPSIK